MKEKVFSIFKTMTGILCFLACVLCFVSFAETRGVKDLVIALFALGSGIEVFLT